MAGVEIEISLEEQKALQALTKLINKMDDTGKSAKENFEGASRAFDTFKGVLGAEIALKGLEAAADAAKELFKLFVVDGVKAASEQEKALKRLDTALKLAGNATDDSRASFLEFANQIQETTGIQDEAALSAIALLQSLAPLTEKGLKEGTKAAADLSSALGVDLDTAIRAVGAAAEGNLSPLQRLTKQTFVEGTSDAETFGNALEQLNRQFGGSAISNFQTFDGAVKGVGNAFEDLIKEFGKTIIENDAVKSAIQAVGATFKDLEGFVNQNKAAISSFITVLAQNLLAAFQAVISAVKQVGDFFRQNGDDIKKYAEAAAIVVGVIGTLVGVYLVYKNAALIAAAAQAALNAVLLLNPYVLAAAAVVGLIFAVKKLIDNFDLVIGTIKVFTGTLLTSLIPAIGFVLDAVGAVASVFNKGFAESINNAKAKLAEVAKSLTESGQAQIDIANSMKEAKDEETNSFVQNENKKQAKAQESNALLKEKQVEQLNIFAELRQARLDQDAAFDQIEADIKTAQDAAEFQRLSDNLGRTEALTQLANAKKLADEGKTTEARKALREADRKAAEKDLGSLFDFEKNTNAGRAANFKSTLGTIATLQSSGSAELFAIGKAAAVATATIDGIAAVQKALASAPPPFNFALAALVGVATAVNVAKIASAAPPSRQDGGLVPGLTSPTDNTLINAAPGELVINRRQQTDLFNAINGGQLGGGASGTNVVIQGNVIADDDTQVQKLIKSINDNINFRNARLAT